MKIHGLLLNNFKYGVGLPTLFFSIVFSLVAHAGSLKPPESSRVNIFLRKTTKNIEVESFVLEIIRALAALRLRLDQAQSHGNEGIEFKVLAADYKQREKSLGNYIKQMMTEDELKEAIRQEIQNIQGKANQGTFHEVREEESRNREKQQQEIHNSVIDGTRAIFHHINHGSFDMGEVNQKVKVTLTKSFEMMATPTTQFIWRKIAELAEKNFSGKYRINASPSRFKGDLHPVERVSFEDIQIWIAALNELSHIGELELFDLIPGHKRGDVYRLPTEAEWEFVIRGRGQYNDKYPFGDDASLLGAYAWFASNAKSKTHPVAEKLPLVIDNKEFFDMLGNVSELVLDWYEPFLSGGVDPQGSEKKTVRVHRGGSWNYSDLVLSSDYRFVWNPSDRTDFVGFRLVRMVK